MQRRFAISDRLSEGAYRRWRTPALLIDEVVLDQNIEKAASIARSRGVALRPHAKTHKSVEIARRQLRAGAVGLTVATFEEACCFLEQGVGSITVARPWLDRARIEAALDLAKSARAELGFAIDDLADVELLNAAARKTGALVNVWIKVDTGLRRVGVDPKGEAGPVLADALHDAAYLCFAGLLSHAGHAYGAADRSAAAEIAEAERLTLHALAARLRHAPPLLSVGTTPTLYAQQNYDGLGEIRPGNYVFNDLMQQRVNSEASLALYVLARVVSVSADRFVLDAGSKALSSDQGAHGLGAGAGFGLAQPLDGAAAWRVARLSEEHGVIELAAGDPVPQRGSFMLVAPNHACAVANLFPSARLVGAVNSDAEIVIDARRG